jgi:hypothetical protein
MKIAKVRLTGCPGFPYLLTCECEDLNVSVCRDGLRAVFGRIPAALEVALDPLENGVRATAYPCGCCFKTDNGQGFSLSPNQWAALCKLLGVPMGRLPQFWVRGCE